MTITNLKDLEKLIKLCRKQGIKAIKVDNIEFALNDVQTKETLEDIFPEASIKVPAFNGVSTKPFDPKIDTIKTDELTPEQLRDWSVQEEPGLEDQQ